MKKIIFLILMCFILSGCSVLKIVTAPFRTSISSTPQSTEKNRKILKCKGTLIIDENGKVECSKGFASDEQTYSQIDRKLSFREKIGQWITKASGYVVLAVGLSVLATMMGFGWIISGFWQSVFGLGRVLRQTVQGIQTAKKTNVDVATALSISQDEDVKRFIIDFKQKNNIK